MSDLGGHSTTLAVRGVHKRFDGEPVLTGVDLTVPQGRTVSLLGPSGCGKTTLLRIVAGLETLDSGEVRLGDRLLSGGGVHVPPERRRVGMVFQDWALFPHLTVAGNVAYGLSRAERTPERIQEILATVGLEGMSERMPATLSGGQQQRVAIARALAPRPSVMLLDEPFSNLDTDLRVRVRTEVHRLLQDLGITTLFVTHDQEEAFVLGDEVAVMSQGFVCQQDTPAALYARPANRWVAGFVGEANLVEGTGMGDHAATPVGVVPLAGTSIGPCQVLVRPEQLVLAPGGTGEVTSVEFYGHDTSYRVSTPTGELIVRAMAAPLFGRGDRVRVDYQGPPTVAYTEPATEVSLRRVSRVLVLGGGPAGLYAGLLLARRGIDVTVLERGEVAGGLAAGRPVGGMAVDHGSHRLHPSIQPGILADLEPLLDGGLQVRPRHGRIRLLGRWLSFPLQPSELATGLGAATTARLAAGAVRAAVTPDRRRTFAEAISTGLGRPMGDLFYFPYARKIWGLEPEEISGEQARRRVPADSPWRLLRKALSRSRGRSFLYPAGGFGRIPEALAEALTTAGGDLRLGAEVTGLRREEDWWSVTTAQGEHRGRLILSTLPLTLLARMLAPPPEVAEALARLRFRAMVLVYLVVPRARYTEYDAHYFPGEEVAFTRVSEPKNYRDAPADPVDRTVLCAEIPCTRGDRLWSTPDAGLVDLVRAGLVSQALPDPGGAGEVVRLPYVYPVYGAGSEQAFDLVDGWVGSHPGLLTFGRQGLFAHDNTHHALAMARAAAAAVREDLRIDEEAWASARRSFREHVVED